MEGKDASMTLPRRFALQSQYNSKYLRFIAGNNQQVRGYLGFSGEQVVSPYTKYEVERSKKSAGLVHIRCSYANKYWRKESNTSGWIAAWADEPNENHSEWSCTLFEPVYVNGKDATQGVRFRNVHSMRYACLWPIAQFCLFVYKESPLDEGKLDVFTIIDWGSLVILPKHVTFKGDNGKYLNAVYREGHKYLEFSSDDDRAPGVGNEVFTTNNGSVVIKSDYHGQFWRRSPNWIWADTNLNLNLSSQYPIIDHTEINKDMLFEPIKLGGNKLALRNLGNNNFCKRLTTEGKVSCLNAGVSTISKEATLEVSEAVVSREIYNVDYHLMDSRIYNQTPISMNSLDAVNDTREPNTMQLKFSYTESLTSTWEASVSLKLGIKVTFEAGIPLIGKSGVKFSSEFTGGYTWGSEKKTEKNVEATYMVTVPGRSRVTVRMLGTRGSCDVPFSYTQRDTLNNGRQVTYHMDDGVYTCVNSYNFKYETDEAKPLVHCESTLVERSVTRSWTEDPLRIPK